MPLPIALISVRLFVRLLLGVLLLSVGGSKLAHPHQFQRGIRDYQLIPPAIESQIAISAILAYGFPIVEIVTGLGLIVGFLLIPATVLAITLTALFSVAMGVNLVRGRTDLSCHCGGAMGNHLISWWLVGRNILLIAGFLFLLLTPVDVFTVTTLARSPSSISAVMWISTVLPIVLLVGVVLAVVVLFNAARVLLRS